MKLPNFRLVSELCLGKKCWILKDIDFFHVNQVRSFWCIRESVCPEGINCFGGNVLMGHSDDTAVFISPVYEMLCFVYHAIKYEGSFSTRRHAEGIEACCSTITLGSVLWTGALQCSSPIPEKTTTNNTDQTT